MGPAWASVDATLLRFSACWMTNHLQQHLLPGERVQHVGRLHWAMYLPGAIFVPILIGIPIVLLLWIRRVTTEMVVTDRRVLVKTGLLAREIDELRLEKVESVQATTFLGLSFGSLKIVGSGGTFREMHWVEEPMAFRNAVQNQADRLRTLSSAGQLRDSA